jgi:hypothetical protein
MIPHNFLKCKIKMTKSLITPRAGIPLISAIAHSIGVPRLLEDKLSSLKKRHRGYSITQHILSLALLLISGGEVLDDIRALQGDNALKSLLNCKGIPASNTTGELLRKFTRRELSQFSGIHRKMTGKIIRKAGLKEITVDIDSTLVKSEKEGAVKTYQGFKGYSPVLVSVHELDMILDGVFRPGNAAPAANLLSLFRRSISDLPPCVEKIRLRSDSAGYNHKLLDWCDEQGIEFVVAAEKKQAVMELVKSRRETSWKRIGEDEEVCETIHIVGRSERVYRLVMVRKVREQMDIFEGGYKYGVFITNNKDWSGKKIVGFYHQRGDSENTIKEAKHGFGLNRLPCGDLLANAGFFQILILAYNLCQVLKYLVLPKEWQQYTVKTLRFRLFNVAGIVVRHAREYILKIPRGNPFYEVFCNAKWRVVGVGVEL